MIVTGLIVLHQVPGPAGVVGICFVVAAGDRCGPHRR